MLGVWDSRVQVRIFLGVSVSDLGLAFRDCILVLFWGYGSGCSGFGGGVCGVVGVGVVFFESGYCIYIIYTLIHYIYAS